MANEGMRVRVLEANAVIGGGVRTEPLTLPGFLHDVCSAVHPMAAASPFFTRLPLAEHGLEWIDPPVLMAHPFDDGTAATLERTTKATAASLPSPDGKAYRNLMDPWVSSWRALFDDALSPPIRIPRSPLLMARLGLYGLRSALGLAQTQFESEKGRAFFCGIAAHTLLPLDRSPTAAFGIMLALGGHANGWPIPRGGAQNIAEALAALIRIRGGEILTEATVGSLDELPDAAATFFDLTPRQVLRICGDRLPSGYAKRLRAYRYAPGVFKVDWALSEPIPWTAEPCRRAGTIHIGPTAADIARSAEASWNGDDDDAPYVLLAQPSLFDDTRAPAGKHTGWAYCHVPHGSTRDMTDAIERQVERFAPGFRDTILARHTFNTREMEAHNANMIGGDINGGVQDIRQFLFRPVPRIDPYRTPLDGVFICSASTPPGGGVHGMCGWHAAQSALRSLPR
jgi:phytoene dehydrogenase-like protein